MDGHVDAADDLSRTIARLQDPDWAARRSAVIDLAPHLETTSVFDALERSLDDDNTAVGEAAGKVLTQFGGIPGLRAVIKVMAVNEDTLGYVLEDVLIFLENDGFPVIERLRALVTNEAPGDVRDTAEDMIERTRSFLQR